MTGQTTPANSPAEPDFLRAPATARTSCRQLPACPACGGSLMEIRHKLQCRQCHTICETCCEGGRG
ncbi:MAG: hypothetical protein KDA79_00575 [Planctomycetaceae bacterium]|nr:hypothetical protein [Planctomycetaceae bacterium]